MRRSADEAEATGRGALWFMTNAFFGLTISYRCVLGREFAGMIHFITNNNHPSNPQQPTHALRKTHQYSGSSQSRWTLDIHHPPIVMI